MNTIFILSANIIGFVFEAMRLFFALAAALLAARILVFAGLVDKGMLNDTYINPIKDFFSRYGIKMALLLLLLVGFYRVSDIVLGVISTVFYLDIGFSKTEIATIVKTFGLLMTIVGGFAGGMLTVRFGVKKDLIWRCGFGCCNQHSFYVVGSDGTGSMVVKTRYWRR